MNLLIERSSFLVLKYFLLKQKADWEISKVPKGLRGRISHSTMLLDKNKNFPKMSDQYFGLAL